MLKKGLFTSIWDGGYEITTSATLDTETGYLDIEQTKEGIDDLENLEEEYFIDEEGTKYEVCLNCHYHIIIEKYITDLDEDGNELPEIAGVMICSDPYCNY